MEVIIKLVSVLIITLFVFNGCISNSSSETISIIWIAGGMSQESYLYEIMDDGSLKISSGNVILDTTSKEIFYGTDTKIKRINLNSKNKSEINALLLKIGENQGNKVNSANDATEVFALIDEKIYWTPFFDDTYTNKNLLELTKKLLELSSSQI